MYPWATLETYVLMAITRYASVNDVVFWYLCSNELDVGVGEFA